jgi:hypothetical protein
MPSGTGPGFLPNSGRPSSVLYALAQTFRIDKAKYRSYNYVNVVVSVGVSDYLCQNSIRLMLRCVT